MRVTLLIAISTILLGAGLCSAHEDGDGDGDFARPGMYFGIGPAWALENLHTSSSKFTGNNVGTTVQAQDTYGADGRVGYRLNRWVAFEGQGQFYGDMELNARVLGRPGSTNIGKVEAVSTTGNVKFYPITGRVQPYVLGGIGLVWAKTENDLPGARTGDDTELAGRGGLGVDVYIDRHFAVNVEGSYLQPASNLKNDSVAAITTGVQYHF